MKENLSTPPTPLLGPIELSLSAQKVIVQLKTHFGPIQTEHSWKVEFPFVPPLQREWKAARREARGRELTTVHHKHSMLSALQPTLSRQPQREPAVALPVWWTGLFRQWQIFSGGSVQRELGKSGWWSFKTRALLRSRLQPLVKVYLAEVGSIATRIFFSCFVQTEAAACQSIDVSRHQGRIPGEQCFAAGMSRDTHLQPHGTPHMRMRWSRHRKAFQDPIQNKVTPN